jgi:hypothetical protein
MHLLLKFWKLKSISPCIKTFAWRLIRRALSTGDRPGRQILYQHPQNLLSLQWIETDAHLFFHCTFARAVWFSANPPLCTSILPIEQDGVQDILTIILDGNSNDDQLRKTITTLWYIWKARNDFRFNNKKNGRFGKSTTLWRPKSTYLPVLCRCKITLQVTTMRSVKPSSGQGCNHAITTAHKVTLGTPLRPGTAPCRWVMLITGDITWTVEDITRVIELSMQGHQTNRSCCTLKFRQCQDRLSAEYYSRRDSQASDATMMHSLLQTPLRRFQDSQP